MDQVQQFIDAMGAVIAAVGPVVGAIGALGLAGAVGGVMSARIKTSSPTATKHTSPGWIARRRAQGGVSHPEDGATLGYRSAFGSVSLTAREFALGGLCLGAPGSGKTTLAKLL